MDADIMAAMGIAGFGKQQKQKKLDPNRFDKNKRAEVRMRAADVSELRTDEYL